MWSVTILVHFLENFGESSVACLLELFVRVWRSEGKSYLDTEEKINEGKL
jgi:hypothetical protein